MRDDDNGFTPLLVASQNGHMSTVTTLLDGGAEEDGPLEQLPQDARLRVDAAYPPSGETGSLVNALCGAGVSVGAGLPRRRTVAPAHSGAGRGGWL